MTLSLFSRFAVSLCDLCVLCVSVVSRGAKHVHHRDTENTEIAQRRIFLLRPNHILVFLIVLCACQFASPQASAKTQTDITVALDGSAQFKSVQDAIMSVPAGSQTNP